MHPVDPYVEATLQAPRQAPPSLDYVSGPKYPPSPDYVNGLEELEQAPLSSVYIPEPEYLEYLVQCDAEAPMKDQPLPDEASPTTLSPGYVDDSYSKEDSEEDPKEDPADYPANEGDDDDESSNDDDDDVEEDKEDEEEEEHLALANSSVVPVDDHVPSVEDTEAFVTDESVAIPPPPPPAYPITSRMSIPSPPLPLPSPPTTSPTYAEVPLCYKAVRIQLRAASPPTHHPSEMPSPPLLLPSTTHKDDLPKADMLLQKRAYFTTSSGRFEVRDSSSAVTARAMTAVGVVNDRVTDLATTQRQDAQELYMGCEDAQDDRASLGAQAMKAHIRASQRDMDVLQRQRIKDKDRLTTHIQHEHDRFKELIRTAEAGPQDRPEDASSVGNKIIKSFLLEMPLLKKFALLEKSRINRGQRHINISQRRMTPCPIKGVLRKNTDSLNTKITKLNEAFSDSKTNLYHYKLALSQVEARLVEFKTREIKFYEKIRGFEFDLKNKNTKIENLMNELEQIKKEKEGLDSKLTGFESASKDLDILLGSKRSNKNKEGLPEFANDTITDYSRPSSSVESNYSDLQNSYSSVSEHGESSESIMSKLMIKFVKLADSPTVIKTNKVETIRKPSVKYAEMYRNTSKSPQDSGCSRHMTGNISYLFNYEPYDGGYVSFGQGGGKITGKECIVLGRDFKLKDDTNVLLRTPRQHNTFSINLNNIFHHKDLTCLVAKASTDESMLWHRRLGHLNFKIMNKLVRHNLVKGLPSKCFENDHTGVACLMRLVAFLEKFITKIENLKDLKVKIIRCDNRGEFRNKEMNDFCSRKGIKREFNNARTPQQNGVTERRNRTLIEAARTMLADAKLPVTFWAEAVNTACYVQNRVLVNKSQNKTSYKLFNGRTHAIGFLKPFGCHVMILNTLDHLGKFDAKSFRVFNKRTKRVEENLHVDFLENKLIEKGASPNWLFDIDTLTNSMNYVPVVVVGTSFTNFSDACNADAPESSGNSNPTSTSKILPTDQMETLIVESAIPTVSSPVLTACLDDSPEPSSDTRLISKRVTSQDDTPFLDNILTLSNRFEDILRVTINTGDTNRVEADLGNMEYNISASPTLTLRIHKDHPKSQLIGLVDTPVQTRHKSKEMEEQSLIATIHQKTTPDLLQFCLFSCFLSQEEPKKISDALKDPSWVEAMQEELLQFKIQNVWILVDCPERKKDGIFLSQDKYVGDILKKFRYSNVRSMDKENPWGKDGTSKDVELHMYRSMIGSLIYLTTSRPDIMFAVCACARHQVTPKECHLHAVKRIFRYLKGHPKLGLWYYKESPFDLVVYSDSDYGSTTQDRKSTTRGCQFLGRRLISCNLIMARLAFCDYHNMIAILEKSEHNVDFHQIVDFIEASHIRIKTTNEGTKILATVDGKLRSISESSIRRNLNLNDKEGISTLPDLKLFENLTLMGYNILPNQKYTFQKEIPTLRQYSKRATWIAQSITISTAANEPTSLIRDNSQGEAFCTVFGLEAGHDRENIIKTSALPHDSTPRVTSLDDLEISNLKAKIKLLEDKDKGTAELSGDDALINGMSLETGEEAGVKRSTEQGSNDTKEMVNVLTAMDAANILTSGVADVSMTLEEIREKFIPVWKQIEDFVPMASKKEGERVKRKWLKLEQGSAKKMKTSEDVSKEDLKEMMQLVPVEEVLIAQGVANALAEYDAERSMNGDDSHDSRSGVRRMFPKELNKIKKYVGELPDMIHGSVMASKPKTMHDAIEFATKLMDQKIRTLAEYQAEKQEEGHFKNNFPMLRNKNQGNQAGNGNAVARAYGEGTIRTNPNSIVVMGTFLLNNRYASILFDTGADRSFVSTTFSYLIDIIPTTLDYSYDIESRGLLAGIHGLFSGRYCGLVRRVTCRAGTVIIYPEFDPFLEDIKEEEKSLDDWDHLLDFNLDDVPLSGGEELLPFVCKMGESGHNKKRAMENLNLFYQDKRTSSSAGGHLTQEEAAKEALAIRIGQKFALLEEERHVELDGKIVKEDDEVVKRIKGEALKEKDDPRAFIFLSDWKGRREETKKVNSGIMMINHTQAKDIGMLINVLCQVGVTTIISKFLIVDIPIDCDAPIVVGRGFLDDEEEYEIKRNKFGAPLYRLKPTPYLNCNDLAERSLALQAVINPFWKISVWKKAVSFLGSLPVPLKQVNWKPNNKGSYTKEEEAIGQWCIEIRLTDPYGNIYLQGFTTKKTDRKLSKLWERTMMRSDHQDPNAIDNMKLWKRYLVTTTLKDLNESEGKLISEDPQLGVPRVGVPRPPRASMQDLYDRMGRMKIRQEAIERMKSQQAATMNRGKAIVNSSQPIYDQEPFMVAEDDETSAGYENQRIGNVAGARETVGSTMVQKSGIQCYNCKEFGHVARECQKPKQVKDAAYHREKMLLSGIGAHYMYMAQLQEVSPDATDSGPIFDAEPLQKVSNDDHYNVFAMESEHPEQSESVHDTYPIDQDAHTVIIDSLDLSYDREEIDQNDDDNDLANERELLASLIEKLKCEIDESKNRNKFLETSNKALVEKLKGEIEDFKHKNKSLESPNNCFKEVNNKLSKTNNLLYTDNKKLEAELARRNSMEYASQKEIKCAKTTHHHPAVAHTAVDTVVAEVGTADDTDHTTVEHNQVDCRLPAVERCK
nr:putative ribonuclease H-like domain-containing protein [Tanacetum cinerariifolium]